MKFADKLWKRVILGICFAAVHGFISLALWGKLFARHMTTQGITSFDWTQAAALIFWFPIGLLAAGNPLAIVINSIALGTVIVAGRKEDRERIKCFLLNILPKSRKSWLILSAFIIAVGIGFMLVSEFKERKARNAPDEFALERLLYRGSASDLKAELDKGHQRDFLTREFIIATWLYCYDISRIPEPKSNKVQKLSLLLDYGADVNAVTYDKSHPNGYDPPILEAADSGDIDLIKLLLKHNADLYLADKSGRRAIDVLNEKRQKDSQLETIWPIIMKHPKKNADINHNPPVTPSI